MVHARYEAHLYSAVGVLTGFPSEVVPKQILDISKVYWRISVASQDENDEPIVWTLPDLKL